MSIRSEMFAWSATRAAKKVARADAKLSVAKKEAIEEAMKVADKALQEGKGGDVEMAALIALQKQLEELESGEHLSDVKKKNSADEKKKKDEQNAATESQKKEEKQAVKGERDHQIKMEQMKHPDPAAKKAQQEEDRAAKDDEKKKTKAKSDLRSAAKGGDASTAKIMGKKPYAAEVFEVPKNALKTKKVKISELVPIKDTVDVAHVEKLIDGEDVKSSSKRPVVVSMDGKLYISDGHHRVAAAKLSGEKDIEVDMAQVESYDLDEKNETMQYQWRKADAVEDIRNDIENWEITEGRNAWAGQFAIPAPAVERADLVETDVVLRKAAGILFIAPGGQVLLGKRAEPGEYFDHWGIFGGHCEEQDGTLENTAIREVMEETEQMVDPTRLQSIATTVVDGTEFTYFVNLCKSAFMPVLNAEHTTFGWFRMEDLLPDPCIPGLVEVLLSPKVQELRLQKMHELDVAKAMVAGILPSPFRFVNMSMYRMRITGTGAAFRKGDGKTIKDEHVYRTPAYFLSADFLERCNGLSVIFQHPKKKIMNSDEFAERMVGTMVCPYIKGDEVWGIAKIWDADMTTILDKQIMSTSPSVVFLDSDSTRTIALNDGSQMYIEECPTLLDHLAVCMVGVWDKGGGPTGIESNTVEP